MFAEVEFYPLQEDQKATTFFEADEYLSLLNRSTSHLKTLEFSLDGMTKDDDDRYSSVINAAPADPQYMSQSWFASDDLKKVLHNCMEEEALDSTRSYSTGRMEEELPSFEIQAGYYSGMSESESQSEPQTSSFVSAPEPSAPKSSKDFVKQSLEKIYKYISLPDLDEIADEKTRNCIEMILPIIFQNHDPEDPTRPDAIAGCNRKVKLMIFMRKDQYVKKAWSKVKTSLYNKHKKPKTLKTAAHEKLKQELAFEDMQVFENLFGSGTCDGLKVESIEYILANQSAFKKIFDHQFFRELRDELDAQTMHDIETNYLKKLEPYLAEGAGEKQRAEVAGHFRSDRSVKTPFTCLENNTSLIILVDQFIKQLKKTTILAEGAKVSLMSTLTSLRNELTQYARTKNWMLEGAKFKKSEIASFLF